MFLVALIVVAFIVALAGGIWLIVLAFRESVLWGLAALFVPFGKLAFVVTHWGETKAPFLTSLGASVVLIGIAFSQPDIIKDPHALHQSTRTDAEVLTDAGPADVTDRVPTATQRAAYARLNAEHTAIRPNTSDVSTYNVRLAHYNDALRELQVEKAQLNALDHPVAVPPGSGKTP